MDKLDEYYKFLAEKQTAVHDSGFEIADEDLNPKLFTFQRYCVKRALKTGRFAMFEDCGLGKTFQQLEWAYQVQKYASPVWMDIDYSKTLNGVKGRDANDEKHICPLQLETIERAITLWSNEGDKVLTPFLGIGSEVYQAIKMRRFGIGFELKESYFNEAIKNCKNIELEVNTPSLFAV